MGSNRYQQVFTLLVILYFSRLEAATIGLTPEGTYCSCVGDKLVFNCSVVGGTTTIWRGTAFDCEMDGSEITLRHSLFESNQAFGICNNGDISGRGLGVVNNCYTSQLNVTVRERFNNKTVQCILNSNDGMRKINESLLSVISATNLHPPPDNLYLTDVQLGKLVFSWTASNCSTLMYNVTSDCGTCPTTTNMTMATCSDLQLTTNAVICHFRVSSRACDFIGNPSSPIEVVLKVPNVPQVEIIPSYSSDSKALQKLFIVVTKNQTEDFFSINSNISGSPIGYIAYDGNSFNSTVNLSSCEEGGRCPIELPPSYCSQPLTNTFSISVSATNILGVGPRSNQFMIDCTNSFVQVLYKETFSEPTISCVFLNQSDTSEKICCVTHRLCDQESPENGQKCNRNSPYNIQLELSDRSSQRYCYTVTASNHTYTVKVKGTFILGINIHEESGNSATIAAGVIVPIVMLLLLGIGITVTIFIARKHRQQQNVDIPMCNDHQQDSQIQRRYLKHYQLPDTLRPHKVDSDSNLREFVTGTLKTEFKRGHTYYEFTYEIENIQRGKQVLLQDKDNGKWFRLVQPEELPANAPKLFGEGIPLHRFGGQFKVFIQSFGSGGRHLPGGTSILYNHGEQVEPDVLQLVPVCSEYFTCVTVKEKCTVGDFCDKNGLRRATFNIFLSLEQIPEETRHQCRDVILMDKSSSDQTLFTGPFAREILNSGNGTLNQNQKWKVFALLEQNEDRLELNVNTEVLYQEAKYINAKYDVISIDEDQVRMSEFIRKKLNRQYEDGKAFYMATQDEEDLLYCKKILRPLKKQLKKHDLKEMKLESRVEYFYAISSVPRKAVKQKDLKLQHCKTFIQSTSQGSRCLKKGTKILYLKEYLDAPSEIQEEENLGESPQESENSCDEAVNEHRD